MTFNNKTVFTPQSSPIPVPTAYGKAPPKYSPPSDVRSIVLDPSGVDPITTLTLTSTVPGNTPTPMPTNTSIYPTEYFKTAVNDIIEAITFLTAPISYEPETVILHIVELR